MALRYRSRPLAERVELRLLLSGTYVVSEVPDAAFTQPVVNYFIRGTPNGPPLQYDAGLGPEINREAFLDTGTSGIIISQDTTQTFQIQNEQSGGQDVLFGDIAIGGETFFNVSEPFYAAIASTNDPGIDDPSNYSAYNQAYGPLITELNPTPDPGSDFGFYEDILGMPVMMNKVVVMDPTVFFNNGFLADMSTFIYNPGTPFNPNNRDLAPGIPTDNMLHVKMSYGDFAPYTTLLPDNATPPVLAPNPIIGPNPLRQWMTNPPPDNTPPVVMNFNGASTSGSFLFDTGAQFSFMSQARAADLHVHYKPGTYGTANPDLVDDNGVDIPNQEIIPASGAGGNEVDAAAFVINSLTLQTQEGVQLRFTDVPIMVLDVGVTNPDTGQELILDGDFGANFLVSSMNGGNDAAFNWITFDQPNGLLGFQPAGTISSGSASVVGRRVFYNNSLFDGNNPATNALDDAAIATDKSALLPSSGTATLSNFTSYTRGINGIMVDVAGIGGTPTASDFNFFTGNSLNGNNWVVAPAPASVSVRPGAGAGGSTRVEVTWADGSIRNTWIQVTLKADSNTGLPANDVFYFGNLVAYSGASTPGSIFTVTGADQTAAMNDPHSVLTPALVTNAHDYNRDGRVDAIDVLAARYQNNQTLVMLSGSTLSAAPAATAAASPAAVQSAGASATGAGAYTPSANLRREHRSTIQAANRLRQSRVLRSLRHLLDRSALIRNQHTRARVQMLLRRELLNARSAKLTDTFPLRVPLL